jgi:hypothetical protein
MEAINERVDQGHLPAKLPVSPPLRLQGPSRNLRARDAQLLHETPGQQRRSVRILTRLQRPHTQVLETSVDHLKVSATALPLVAVGAVVGEAELPLLEEDSLLVSE